MHCGYIVEVKELRPHTNADKLQIATFFGSDTCVSLEVKLGDIGIYFPSDLQLSEKYCIENHLLRKLPDGTPDTGYLEPDKRNIKAIKLRGERSDGIFMPLTSLSYLGDISELKPGITIDTWNGEEICKKYIPRSNHKISSSTGYNKKNKKAKVETLPHFVEHIDTPQLRFCQNLFKPGDVICLTEKVHGTSSRNANTISITRKKNIFDKIFHRVGKEVSNYKYVIGTRRTVVENSTGGYYGSNEFRINWGKEFEGKLHAGEEVFGEIAGFTETGTPIMGIGNNEKTKDKAFIKKFGPTTTFSYGCSGNESRFFIYRMTYTSPDGYTIEYPWDLVKLRAEQMGFEVVPELDRFIYTTEEDFMNRINRWLDIPSTIDNSHIIEGVVVRALNAPGFRVAKEKSYNFKIIEGIIKESAEAPDMEEAEEFKNS